MFPVKQLCCVQRELEDVQGGNLHVTCMRNKSPWSKWCSSCKCWQGSNPLRPSQFCVCGTGVWHLVMRGCKLQWSKCSSKCISSTSCQQPWQTSSHKAGRGRGSYFHRAEWTSMKRQSLHTDFSRSDSARHFYVTALFFSVLGSPSWLMTATSSLCGTTHTELFLHSGL